MSDYYIDDRGYLMLYNPNAYTFHHIDKVVYLYKMLLLGQTIIHK